MKIKKFLILLFLVLPTFVFTKENFNIGLVNGLWFSNYKIFDGDNFFVNTVFYNNSDFDISGIVVFYDNSENFFEKKVIVKKNNIKYIKAPYLANAGMHEFEAKIILAQKMENGQETEEIQVGNNFILGSKKINIDLDTDNDGLGNIDDLDDDGDGHSDLEEIGNNSDPLDKNSIPENTNSTTSERIKTVIQEVKEASDNIFTRAETFRTNTANFLEDKITTRESKEKKENQKNEEKKNIIFEEKTNPNISNTQLLKKQSEQKSEESTDYYLFFLKFMYFIFNSIILSILFFIFVVWVLYKLTKRLVFRDH